MSFSRRFELPDMYDDMMFPECDDCETDPCTPETMEKCTYYIQWNKDEQAMMESLDKHYKEMDKIKKELGR